MSDLEADLVALLEPLLRRLVREEVKRAQLEWRWRSVRQAAEILDLSENAVRIRCSKGQLPHRKLDGRLFVDMEAVDRTLRA